MIQLEYLNDQNGYKKAVVVPIDLWNRIFNGNEPSEEDMAEIRVESSGSTDATVAARSEP